MIGWLVDGGGGIGDWARWLDMNVDVILLAADQGRGECLFL